MNTKWDVILRILTALRNVETAAQLDQAMSKITLEDLAELRSINSDAFSNAILAPNVIEVVSKLAPLLQKRLVELQKPIDAYYNSLQPSGDVGLSPKPNVPQKTLPQNELYKKGVYTNLLNVTQMVLDTKKNPLAYIEKPGDEVQENFQSNEVTENTDKPTDNLAPFKLETGHPLSDILKAINQLRNDAAASKDPSIKLAMEKLANKLEAQLKKCAPKIEKTEVNNKTTYSSTDNIKDDLLIMYNTAKYSPEALFLEKRVRTLEKVTTAIATVLLPLVMIPVLALNIVAKWNLSPWLHVLSTREAKDTSNIADAVRAAHVRFKS